jgi:hypothetical protein
LRYPVRFVSKQYGFEDFAMAELIARDIVAVADDGYPLSARLISGGFAGSATQARSGAVWNRCGMKSSTG